jgi:hypothetical protein
LIFDHHTPAASSTKILIEPQTWLDEGLVRFRREG